MLFLIILLTCVMVLDCLALIFLVLIQLPKKDAGAGLAFGGSATDALFGAGSGTVLTKITKYAAGAFFVLALLLSVMQSKYHHSSGSEFKEHLEKSSAQPPIAPPSSATPPSSTAPASKQGSLLTNTNLPAIPAVESTNLPARSTATSAPPVGTNTAAPK
jgi:preprotein translocase subunit SecG